MVIEDKKTCREDSEAHSDGLSVFASRGSWKVHWRSRLGGRTVYLDLVDLEAMLNIELDGRRYHSTAEQRERDIARDVALAQQGFLTLRFSHERLTRDPEGCRRQALAVRAVRLEQLHERTDRTA